MTNDQKLLYLINATGELINAEEKALQTNSILFREEARKKRNALKIWIASNKVVTTDKTPPARKIKKFQNNSRLNWLAK